MVTITRRKLIEGVLGVSGSLAATGLLAACSGGAATPTAAPAAAASKPTAAPTATSQTTTQATTAAPTPTTAASTTPSTQATAATTTSTSPTSMTVTKFALNNAKLTAWAYQSFTPSADRWISEQAQAWGKANGGSVEYDIVQNSVFTQKLAAAIEAKSLPDLIMTGNILYYKGLNILADVTDEFNKLDKMAGGFYKSFLPGIQDSGKVWGLPIETGPSPLFARLDILQKVNGNKAPPKTLDDMETVAKKANNPPNFYGIGWTLGRTPDCVGNVTDVMFNDGGYLVNKEGTKPTVQSDGTIAALTRIKRWWDEKLIPPDSTSWDDTGNNSAYQSKRVAFVDNPASIYAWLVTHDKNLLANTGMFPIPAGKVGAFNGGAGGWAWGISAQSKSRDGAIALADFLLLPNNLELECEKIGGRWYPPYKDLAKLPFWTSQPQLAFYPTMIEHAVYGSYPAPPKPQLMAALGEASTALVIADMAQAVVVSGTSVDKAVADAQAKFEAIFKKYKLG